MKRLVAIPIILFLVLAGSQNLARASFLCPGCVPTVTETRAEIVARSDVVLLAQWADAKPVDGETAAFVEFQVTLVGKDHTETYEKDQRIRLDEYITADPGNLFLLTGTRDKEEVLKWDSPAEISETGYHYVMQAPSPELPRHERLAYYLKFLEISDPFISNDAYNEFALAPFESVVPLTDQLPREKLRKWLKNEDGTTTKTHIGLYGIMLGLCGEKEDAELLRHLFADNPSEYAVGMEGVVTGYLFLAGADGLDYLRSMYLQETEDKVDRLYPLMQSLRIVWTYGEHRVPHEAMIETMRVFLNHKRLASFAIADLARWQDWQSTSRLISMFDKPEFDNPDVQRAIVQYMAVCADETTTVEGESQTIPEAKLARAFLDKLEEEQPVVLRRALRAIGGARPDLEPASTDTPAGEKPEIKSPPAPGVSEE